MYVTCIGRKLYDVILIVTIKSLSALDWELLSLYYFLWKSFDAAMSKLSFRARALDANKSLPVFHEEDVPDLPDIASVNRVVPQMPTGMEKEEETEHHLQRAISAQQIYGGSQRLIIPTPDAILYDAHYKQLIRRMVHMPKQLIHVQAFTLEDELPDYDCDEEDEQWLENYNKKNSDKPINILDFEQVVDTLEKSCSSRIDLFTLSDAQALVKKDESVVQVIFHYWKEKRSKVNGQTLTPAVRTEKKDGTALHDPYVAFRRRIEKMQTRKNRKNDESSYEKMLKLRRDLNRACLILEMVKQREENKRDLLQTTIKILESRYANKDFSGELLHQCFELLKQRQLQQEHKPPLQPSNINLKDHGEHKKRSELIEEQKKRHKLLKQQQRAALLASSEDAEAAQAHAANSREADKSNEGPDGKFTFRRKKGVIYHAPRYDSMGNWPWTHPVEGGSGLSQYSFSKTSILKQCRCIGYARRRVGRGGRVNFDRVYAQYDDITNDKSDCFGSISSSIDERVPPWPHYRPQYDSSSDDEDKLNIATSIQRLTKELCESNDSTNSASNKTPLYRSFSTQPTSRFRIHPYSKHRTSTDQSRKSRSSVNNQAFIAATIAASISKSVEKQSWIIRRSNSHQLFGNRNRKTLNGNVKSSSAHHLSVSPSRPASTAPASAIYQLNFPITTKIQTASSMHTKVNTTVSNTSLNNNNTILRTVVKTSAQTSLQGNTTDNSFVRTHVTAGGGASLQTSISRQPLSIVQQQSLIAAQQKIIPQSTVSAVQQGSILQVQPVLNNVRNNKINSIPKGLTINHNTVVSNGISTQPQSIQQLAR